MSFLRQLAILSPSEIPYPVTIIGLGGIGRPVAETLAEMGCREITLWDPDRVEEHNRPNQAYRKKDISKLKVKATKEIIQEFAEWCEVTVVPEKFAGQRPLEGIVISAVDTMESRMKIWKAVRYNLNVPLYIDGRIGGEIVQVFTVKPCQIEDIEAYEQTLFPDKEAAQLACTAQQIIYVGKMIGGLIALQFKKWLKKQNYHHEITFDLVTMTLLLDKKLES